MAICSFFLQGRCKFGDRCWNEHPRDGRHQGHNRYQSESSNWNSSSQRYVQPSSFSKNLTWTRDNDRSFGSGSGDNRNRSSKPNEPPGFFSPQNRFGALANQEHARESGQDKEENLIVDIIKDMEMWESSGQWMLSVYCVLKEQRHLSGFTDISPEELRLECYTSHKDGNLQNYMNSVQQLVTQWKQRIRDIKNMNPSSNSALLSQLTKPPSVTAPSTFAAPQQSGSFGGPQQTGFGTSNISANMPVSAASFNFKPDTNTAAPNAGPTAPAFGNKPSFGFGNTGTVSASSFSFAPTTTSGGAASTFSGFGSASAAPSMAASGFGGTVTGGFGSSVSAVPGFGGTPSASGFGGLTSSTKTSGFGAVPAGAGSLSTSGTSLFGQGVTVSSASNAVSTSAADSGLSSALFTPRNELSQEDLQQFECKMFTLGKIPLLPPPADLLTVK
ncbi:nucleoporin NUP42-like [Dendropsophus ebraccatus]|uniref:nucleoporin NUP42-like n=1 Tax=Dendropsophus ebraccatus TaxID=150705 RepID=UPI00383186AC